MNPATKPKVSVKAPRKEMAQVKTSASASTTSPLRKPPPPPEASEIQSVVGSYTQKDRDAMDTLFTLDLLAKRVKDTGVGAPVPEPNCGKPVALQPAPVASQEPQPRPPAPEEAKSSRFKSVREIASYINCYMDEKDYPPKSSEGKRIKRNKEAYFKEYKPFIAISASEFEIPENYLTCLLMRENQFDKNKVSTAGALGIAQLMPGTLQDMSKLLKWGKQAESKLDLYIEQAANRDGKVSRKSQEEAKVYLMVHTLWLRWKSYFQKLKTEGKFEGDIPVNLSKINAENPKVAIAISGFYLRFIIDTFEENLNETGNVKTTMDKEPDFDFLITIGGAYNMGHGGAANVLERVRPRTSAKWRAALSKTNGETKLHMNSIANCLEKGSMKPPGRDRQKECPQ